MERVEDQSYDAQGQSEMITLLWMQFLIAALGGFLLGFGVGGKVAFAMMKRHFRDNGKDHG